MKQAALRGLIIGLALSAGVLSMRPAFELGAWLARTVHPQTSTSEVYLDVR